MLKNMEDSTKLFLIGIIFLLMILYILITAIKDRNRVDYNIVSDYLNNMKDNYSLDVKVDDKTISYSRDKDVEVFQSEQFENNTYAKINNKLYIYKDDKLTEVEQNNDLNDKYNYDMNLIKKVVNYCNYKMLVKGDIICSIPADNYNKEFQELYGLGRLNSKDIVMDFIYEDKTINKIIINYNDSTYDIEITNVGNNNYSGLLEMIK